MTYMRSIPLFQKVLLGISAIGLIFSAFAAYSPVVHAQISEAERAVLEAQLEQLEAEIARQEAILSQQKGQSASISNEISKLKAQVSTARSKINYRNTQIKKLSSEITTKDKTVRTLSADIEQKKQSIAKLVREARELDDRGILHIVLASENVSSFYKDADSFVFVKRSLKDKVDGLLGVKKLTEEEKKALEAKKGEEEVARLELERQRRIIEQNKAEEEKLLAASKNQEKVYEKIIADREQQAAQIRAQLFELVGVPEGGIPFGEAYEYAKFAASKTGVDPAFLLAIATQETGIGKNVGTCNRVGDAKTYKDVMPGPAEKASGRSWRDDQSIFEDIVDALGLPRIGTPVSCPAPWGGWGGAMGPMQFIPATWKGFAKKTAAAVGASTANPWNPRHAFTASAIYLSELGADGRTFNSEREAACKYYSGRGCMDPKVKNLFYGNSVMKHKSTIQAKIDVLEG
jgi:peptidoglycan hydrolase CwlO-like protein